MVQQQQQQQQHLSLQDNSNRAGPSNNITTPDKKPSKHQLKLIQHPHQQEPLKHQLSWPGPGTPTIVLDQVLLPLSPTEDPLILKVSPRHPNQYYSASPSYRHQTANQSQPPPRRSIIIPSTATRTSDSENQHNLDLSSAEHPPPRTRNRSMVSPATPPKPRIWDDDNAFHAFQVEHSKLGVDLTISCDESPAETSDRRQNKIKERKKHKISMGHVEIVMSELDKARFKAQHNHNRLQVRYSTDGLRKMEIEESRRTRSPSSTSSHSDGNHSHQVSQRPSPSTGPHQHGPVHEPNHRENASPNSGSVSSLEHYSSRSRSPVLRHQSHLSISSSSRNEEANSSSTHEKEQQPNRSSSEAHEQEDTSPYIPAENRLSSSPRSEEASLPEVNETEHEPRGSSYEAAAEPKDTSNYRPSESRRETPSPLHDRRPYAENDTLKPSSAMSRNALSDIPSRRLTSRKSPGGFIRESEEYQPDASPINQDAFHIDQETSHTSQKESPASENTMGRVHEPELARDRMSSESPVPQVSGMPEEVVGSDSDQEGRSNEEIASRLCSVESGHDNLPGHQGDYSEEEEEEDRQGSTTEEDSAPGHQGDYGEEEEEKDREGSPTEEDSARSPSPTHPSSPAIDIIDENSQANPIPISSSVSPSVDLPSCSPQSSHHQHSLKSTSLAPSDRSGLQLDQNEQEVDDRSQDPESPHRDSQQDESHSSRGSDRQSEQSPDEDPGRSPSPEIQHSSQPNEGSASESPVRDSSEVLQESQDVDHSVSLDDLTLFKAQGNLKHFTSTPRGVLHHPVPFPAVTNPTTGRAPSSTPRPSTYPIVEIASSDPKVAARAAAILKVHHGFVPRGCKVENTGLMGDDDLEREMELSIQREEADRSLRLQASSTTASSAPHNLLRTVQTKNMFDQCRPEPSQDSFHHLFTENERQRTPELNHHSRAGPRSPSSVASTTRQDSLRRKAHHNHCKSLKEELQQLDYRPDFHSWSQADWKILEFCFKRIERKQPLGPSSQPNIQPEEVVLKMLEALDLGPSDCQSEWEWTKMIYRVIALQKRRSADPSRRSRCSSATTSTSQRRPVERPSSSHISSRHQTRISGFASQALGGGPARSSSVSEEDDEEEVRWEDGREVYPSLEPVRRAFSRSRTTTPLPRRAHDRHEEEVQHQGSQSSPATAPSGQQTRVPKAPPISDRFRRQSLRNTLAYWKARGPRRVGKGKIWTIVAAFEARFDKLLASLSPPPNILHYLRQTDTEVSSRPNKRALNHSDNVINPSSSSTTTTSTTTLFHPSFTNEFYSEHPAPPPHKSHSWKKQRKT
ncbi:hypothetical protein PGT21_033756 [Puccinia graminis f. sp. tritici]|uniref:Uncharacterized protein n=1 Tax=Puccinia graminis f. sp. tritici TaxID=56615 RepID=A0A5B0LR30_PUCGR|nr:hypothetical protein PGT21_033756 [Puccinia graminis f. sp. tritici]KAA1081833.1 hypothetical protein PGTUg99_015474 [Puccinia graminis f. sp. tritici]